MKKTLLPAAILASAIMPGVAQDIISWAYNNGNAIPTTGTAGVVAATNWNLTGDSGSLSLNYNDGNSSGTSLSLSGGFGAWGIGGVGAPDGDGTYNKAIFDGYYNSFSSSLTLGNIPYANYNVLVYFSSDADGRTGTISDGTTTYSFSTMAVSATAGGNALFAQTTDTGLGNPSADYAIFSGLTGGSQTFTIDSNPDNGMGIAGVQIVAVPEPSTVALTMMGGIGLHLMLSRRRKI
jgi:hypothetical protein